MGGCGNLIHQYAQRESHTSLCSNGVSAVLLVAKAPPVVPDVLSHACVFGGCGISVDSGEKEGVSFVVTSSFKFSFSFNLADTATGICIR